MSKEPSKTIGVILASIAANFRDSLLDGLSSAFYEKGYQLVIGLTNNDISREKDFIQKFSKTTDCIIIISAAERYTQIESAVTGTVPMLFLINKPEGCPFSCILESDYSAIYQAIISSANQKKSTVGCICSHRELSATRELLRAYQDAVTASSLPFSRDLIYDVGDDLFFRVDKIIEDMVSRNCYAILAGTPAITNRILDYLVFYNTDPANEPFQLFGYGMVGSTLASQMNIDVIVHPVDHFIDLTVQACIYLIHHPDYKNTRDYLIKGKLRMHTYNGLRSYQD